MKINTIFVATIAYALGVFTSYNFFKTREKARADEEIKSAIDHITHRVNGGEAEVKEEPKETKKTSLHERSSIDSGEKQYDRVDYSTKMKKVDSAEMESPKEDDDNEEEDDDSPHEITMDDYFSMTGVEKKSLQWFKDNDVLVVTDSMIDDVTPYDFIDDEGTILGDVLTTSGFKKDDFVSLIYIYNPTIAAAYEITKVFDKYEW